MNISIHLKKKQGMFRVESYDSKTITLVNRGIVPASEFRCFAGGKNNCMVSVEDMDKFHETVDPEGYHKSQEHIKQQYESIREMCKLLEPVDDPEPEYEPEGEPDWQTEWEHQVSEQEEQYIREQEVQRTEHDYLMSNSSLYALYYNSTVDLNIKVEKLEKKILSIGRDIYSKFKYLPVFDNYKTPDSGIKFIIQQGELPFGDIPIYRFCFDPYQFMSNFHSSIDLLFRNNDWTTLNGGWMKIKGDTLFLYGKSGDYGVFNPAVAIEAAKEIFKNHKIIAYPDAQIPE